MGFQHLPTSGTVRSADVGGVWLPPGASADLRRIRRSRESRVRSVFARWSVPGVCLPVAGMFADQLGDGKGVG